MRRVCSLLLLISPAVLAQGPGDYGMAPRANHDLCLVQNVQEIDASELGSLTRYHVFPDANPDGTAHMLVADALVGEGLDVTWGPVAADGTEIVVEIHGKYPSWNAAGGPTELLILFRTPGSRELIAPVTYIGNQYYQYLGPIELRIGSALNLMQNPSDATPC